MTLLDDEERYRINVFDWRGKEASRQHQGAGGFDAVIGNPPYVRIQRIPHVESDYLFRTYQSPTSKIDLSLVFLEKGLQVANPTGRVGFICTSQWLSADYGQNLRRMLRDGRLHRVVDFGSLPVFANASTYPAILLLSPKPAESLSVSRITSAANLNLRDIEAAPVTILPLSSLDDGPWSLGGLSITKLLDTAKLSWKPLSEFGGSFIGCKTGLNDAFVLPGSQARGLRLEKTLLFPYALHGEQVSQYATTQPDYIVIYPYREGPDGGPELIAEAELRRDYPRIHAHLVSFKDRLRQRLDSRRLYASGPDWYRHLRAGSFRYIKPSKIVFKAIAKRASAGILPPNTAFDGARCPAVILNRPYEDDTSYFLGVFNSRLATYYLKSVCPPKLNNYIEFTARGLASFPVRCLDLSKAPDKSAHERITSLVKNMLELTTKLSAANTPQEQTALERQIVATDTQLDTLIYALYGLTDAEIKTLEAST